jgi:hypothetical protein
LTALRTVYTFPRARVKIITPETDKRYFGIAICGSADIFGFTGVKDASNSELAVACGLTNRYTSPIKAEMSSDTDPSLGDLSRRYGTKISEKRGKAIDATKRRIRTNLDLHERLNTFGDSSSPTVRADG